MNNEGERGSRSRFLVYLCAAGLLTLTACATLSEAELEARQYERTDYQERFRDFRQRCLAGGGLVIVNAPTSIDRNGVPGPGSRYTCS